MLSVLLLVSTVSAAAPVSVAIVDLDTPDFMLGLAAQVHRTLMAEAKAQKFEVVSPEMLREKLDAKHYGALKKCGAKVACAAQELEASGLSRVVLGSLSRSEKSYLLKLWLFDLKKLSLISQVDRSILIASRRFQTDMEQAIPPFLRGEAEASGTLTIESNLRDVQVSINGEVAGVPPLTLTLKPGKYELKAERNKYLPITRLVAVEANQVTQVEMKLLLMPGQVPDDQLIPALARKGGASAPGGAWEVGPATWTLGAVTVAAAGTGLAFGLIASRQERALRSGYDADTAVYLGTRAQALEQNRNALIANVSFGIAGGALVGTVISLLIDANRSPVVVAPALSPAGGGVSVGGQF